MSLLSLAIDNARLTAFSNVRVTVFTEVRGARS